MQVSKQKDYVSKTVFLSVFCMSGEITYKPNLIAVE